MKTEHPVDIGSATINKSDPHELAERIQYLVRHEMPFTDYEEMLDTLLEHQQGNDWRGYERFAALLREYRSELGEGSVHAAEVRDHVVGYCNFEGGAFGPN